MVVVVSAQPNSRTTLTSFYYLYLYILYYIILYIYLYTYKWTFQFPIQNPKPKEGVSSRHTRQHTLHTPTTTAQVKDQNSSLLPSSPEESSRTHLYNFLLFFKFFLIYLGIYRFIAVTDANNVCCVKVRFFGSLLL